MKPAYVLCMDGLTVELAILQSVMEDCFRKFD